MSGPRCLSPRSATRATAPWTLYFGDRYGKWTMYFDLDTNQPIDVILDEIGKDPTCVFWG